MSVEKKYLHLYESGTVIPGLTRDPFLFFVELVGERAKWIPAFAGMTVPLIDGMTVPLARDSATFTGMAATLGAFVRISYASCMRETTDEQLMQRYANGETKAFDQLYARHRGALYRYFNRQVNNAATANDLYQGAWEKIIKARRSYHASKPFTAWMYRIAHNHLVDHYRRLRPDEPIETHVLADHQPGPVQDVIDGEQHEQLRAGIIALPAEQRNTLLLKLETGLKMKEIANVTGVSTQTVKSRLRYAVNKLKRSQV